MSGARSRVWCQALSLSLRAARPCCPCVLGVGVVGLRTQHRPHSMRSCGPALRPVGVAGGRPPGGVSRAVARGAYPPLAALAAPGAAGRGPLPMCRGRGCAGMGARHCPFGERALRGAACRGGAERPSRGAYLSLLCGAGVWCQALSPSQPPVPWGRVAGLRCLCFLGAGGVGVGGPAPAPQRALLRASIACCEGRGRAFPGLVPCAVARGV